MSGIDFHCVDSCPQCESDLLPFRLLAEYELNPKNALKVTNEQEAITAKEIVDPLSLKEKVDTFHVNKLLCLCFIGMFVLMFITLMWQAVFFPRATFQGQSPQFLTEKYSQVQPALKTLNERLQLLENQLAGLSPLPPPMGLDQENIKYTMHPWRASDTLWDIAQKYWHKGSYYPVLLETNKGLNIHHNPIGLKIKILKRIDTVNAISDRIIKTTDDHRRYMRYLVQPQDNWAFIAKRFYGKSLDQIGFRRSQVLAPGKRITIALME